MPRLCVIPGDGIGREVVPAAVQVLQAVVPELEVVEAAAGFAVFEATGTALPAETLALAREVGAVLFGAVSSPSHPVAGYRSPIVALRRELDAFANLRPALARLSDTGVDVLVVRENTEGLYLGQEQRETGSDGRAAARGIRRITEAGSERVARLAFDLAAQAGRRLTIVHKANVLRETDGLWREVCLRVSREFPAVAVDEVLVDAAAYHLVRTPMRYQLLLCPNFHGDILSDLVSGLADGLGMAPSVSLGAGFALAEPVHGSAPDIAGQGIANPIAAILSAALLCRHRWDMQTAAAAIETAVTQTLAAGYRTPDLRGTGSHTNSPEQPVGTAGMAQAVLDRLL